MVKVAIIHGPSASGKSTISHRLRSEFGKSWVIVEQDAFHFGMFGPDGHENKHAESAILIELVVKQLLVDGFNVILEGIFNPEYYLQMLKNLVAIEDAEVHTFYLQTDLEVTKLRHLGRSKAAEFGPEKLDKWWYKSSEKGLPGEIIINTTELSFDEVFEQIASVLS
jgi:predicted kinase